MDSVKDLREVRRFAMARSLFPSTTLAHAVDMLGFVQADPIRAPARAQDLTLRHRVARYRAGDLERRYPDLDIEEDAFINYGFLPRASHALMHPRVPRTRWGIATQRRASALLEFVRERGVAHPRDVDLHFAHGAVRNYWGGSSNATTHLLDAMHYRGLLRVARRDNGIRLYAVREANVAPLDAASRRARLDALVDIVVRKYAPVPAPSLAPLVRRLRYGAPQLRSGIDAALGRARRRLAHARVDGVEWYWPAHEEPAAFPREPDEAVRVLAPFDPIVWDRARFARLFGWSYRFEAYTPIEKRKLGYYALPLLWRDRAIGWANLSVRGTALLTEIGYVDGRAPREAAFGRALEHELSRMRIFLGL
jgi:uncharacterized protein YcaQ